VRVPSVKVLFAMRSQKKFRTSQLKKRRRKKLQARRKLPAQKKLQVPRKLLAQRKPPRKKLAQMTTQKQLPLQLTRLKLRRRQRLQVCKAMTWRRARAMVVRVA
jgi:hypothetical protein